MRRRNGRHPGGHPANIALRSREVVFEGNLITVRARRRRNARRQRSLTLGRRAHQRWSA